MKRDELLQLQAEIRIQGMESKKSLKIGKITNNLEWQQLLSIEPLKLN